MSLSQDQAIFWRDVLGRFKVARDLLSVLLIESPSIREKSRLARLLHMTQRAVCIASRQENIFYNCGFMPAVPAEISLSRAVGFDANDYCSKIICDTIHLIKERRQELSTYAGRCMESTSNIISIFSDFEPDIVALGNFSIQYYLETSKIFLRDWKIPFVPGRDVSENEGAFLMSKTIVQRIYGQINNIEVAAAESCTAMILMFGEDAPYDLQLILSEQILDEMRHAIILQDVLDNKVVDQTVMPKVSYEIWNAICQTSSIAEALCAQQVIGEGYSIGNDLLLRDFYRANGFQSLSEIHEFIHSDEVDHARNGIFWFKISAKEKAGHILDKMENKLRPSTLCDPYFCEDIRLRVGFSTEDILRQRKLCRKKELVGEKVSIFN